MSHEYLGMPTARQTGHRPLKGSTGIRRSILLAAMGLTVALGCKKKEGDSGGTALNAASSDTNNPSSDVSLPVVGEPARRGDLVLYVPTVGTIKSDIVEVKALAGGPVIAVRVRAGQTVRKGDTLALVDPRDLDIAVANARADYQMDSLELEENLAIDAIGRKGKPIEEQQKKIAELRAGIARSKTALETALLQRSRAAILAPINGTFEEVTVLVGQHVGEGTTIGKMVDLMNLRIEALVLENDLPNLKVGGAALVKAAAMPDKPITGRIDAILPVVDNTSRAGHAIILARGNGLYRPGMYTDVRLEANRLKNRILVPFSAVIERDGRPLVFVVRNGRAQWQYIFPGKSNGMETEVLPDTQTNEIPIKPGDIVLTQGHLTLTHDAPVNVIAKQERGTH